MQITKFVKMGEYYQDSGKLVKTICKACSTWCDDTFIVYVEVKDGGYCQ